MKLINGVINLLVGLFIINLAWTQGVSQYITGDSSGIRKFTQLKEQGEKTMGVLDDEFLSSNLGNFIDYTFEVEGKQYTGSYDFHDESELLSPIVEVTYMADDPTINGTFVEEQLQKMIENSKSTSFLIFSLVGVLFGAFLVYMSYMQVVVWIRALKE